MFDHNDLNQHARPKPVARMYEIPGTRSAVTASSPMSTPSSTAMPVAPVRMRRGRTAGLLFLALLTGAAGGGAAGSFAAMRSLPTAAAGASVVSAEPINMQNQAAAAANVAGAVFAAVSPSVVEISVAGETPMGMTYSGGTGFVVDARGLILTNNHVVASSEQVEVQFSDGTTRTATVLGTDSGNDLALLETDLPANVPVARLADSDAVTVGETAVAIGSPFGLEQTVTQGIVSAIHRTWSPGTGRTQRNLIQTDAPINPGNSGGPLLNAAGEVIGITSMIESPVRGSVGVGFAIPINTAKQLIPQLEAGAELKAVWLGIRGGDVTAALAEERDLPVQEGVLVAEAVQGGPAARAGLQPEDIITALDQTAVKTLGELQDALSQHQPGDTVTLSIMRAGAEQELDVRLEAWVEQ
jgi:S1-C subfamily serine protease